MPGNKHNELRVRTSVSLFFEKRPFSAEGAAFNAKAWGIAPGLMVSKTPALKARITSSAIETRFQR
jgi:hypothetical protein